MVDWTNDGKEDSNNNRDERQTFQGTELAVHNETAALAVAAAEKAAIESRYVLAMRVPRDWDTIRQLMLKECRRPGFAAAAIYRKPIGGDKTVEGLSIRFAEAAIRYMRNFYASAKAIYDDLDKVIIRVSVMDLESNATVEDDVTVSKTVERKFLNKGLQPLAVRTNSYGETVYIVPATDDQVLNKKNALVSKSLRNGVLRLLPGDIQDECEALCRQVAAQEDAKDPTAAKKKLFDSFAQIGILPDQLKEYLGHANDLSPKELAELRGIYSAVSQGDTSWSEIVAAQKPAGDDKAAAAQAKKVDDIVSKHTAKANEKKGGKPADAKPAEPKSEPKPADDPGTHPGDREPGDDT